MDEVLRSEAERIFNGIRKTLLNRSLYQKLKGGERREVQWLVPSIYLPDERAFMFLVDMERLPVKKEQLTDDPAVAKQISATLGGRPVAITNSRGVAVTVGRDVPERVERQKLPRRVDLDLDAVPEGDYMLPIGRAEAGPLWRPLAELDTVLVAGTRRQGKSMWLNAALAALLTTNGPERLQVALIDLKEVELQHWQAAPHLFGGEVAVDAAGADRILGQLLGELDRRRALFSQVGARELDTYNERAAAPLPAILLVADEVPDLALAGADRAIRSLVRIVQKGGAFGIHAVITAQRPDSTVITGLLKSNLGTRITFWLPSTDDYRIALNPPSGWQAPAGMTRAKGRLIARLYDGERVCQGYYLDDDALAAAVARVAGGQPGASVLAPAEADMVRWAIAENGGYLGRAEIAGSLGVSDWKAGRIGAEWEHRGWLEKDPAAGNKRRVTVALAEIAG